MASIEAVHAGQILDSRSSASARDERVAKYNQLMRIEEHLGDAAVCPGASPRFTVA